jgi:SAM-dependent methyltransferase
MRKDEAAAKNDTRAQAWSRYWVSGVRHSCPGSFGDHYGPATQAFWQAQFRALGQSDRVLELGCGNGSLIRYFAEVGGTLPAAIEAVDLAELDERWLAQLPKAVCSRVRLHPRTSAASVSLAESAITQVWSQYALEYFVDEACWQSLARMLAPRALIATVTHHRNSHLYRVAQVEMADSALLLAHDGPLDRAAEMLPWLVLSADARGRERRDADPRATEARRRFNAIFAAVGERIATSPFPDLLRDAAERVMRILHAAPASGEAVARKALEALRADLSDNRLRVTELEACALDHHAIEAWAQRLRRMGFTAVEIGEVVEQGYLLGWSLAARRDGSQ